MLRFETVKCWWVYYRWFMNNMLAYTSKDLRQDYTNMGEMQKA